VVRAGLGNRVDAAARESALTNVVGRDHQLDFLNGVEADRLRAGRAAGHTGAGGETEEVVVHRAVNLNAVVALAAPGDGCGGRIFVDAHRIEIDIRPDHVDQAP